VPASGARRFVRRPVRTFPLRRLAFVALAVLALLAIVALSLSLSRVFSAASPPLSQSASAAAQPAPNTDQAASSTDSSLTATWEKRGRVNFLLLGLDKPTRGGLQRSDSITIVTVDTVNKTAGMLTIPRDLMVNIPGQAKPTQDRINTAHVWGDLYKYPGGGPALAKRTIYENFGIPIDYYVSVDFDGLMKIVDAVGGVDINVEKAVNDKAANFYMPTGMQHMDGETALWYARSRMGDSDFWRARRQQQVLMALREKALRLDILSKLPALLPAMWGTIRTDLSPADVLALAPIAKEIDVHNIRNRVIDETMVTSYRTPLGASVLLPKWEPIRQAVREVFSSTPAAVASSSASPTAPPPAPTATEQPAPTPAPTAAPSATDERTRLAQEGARVEILNGTNTKGLAARTRTFLQGRGVNVVRIGDADRYTYTQTIIYDYNGRHPFTRDLLAKLLGVAPQNVRQVSNPAAGVDLRIILGSSVQVP
jgi:LCP family protein required for cell wall assembly